MPRRARTIDASLRSLDRAATLAVAGCALILAGMVFVQRRELRAKEDRFQRRLARVEAYWQMRYDTLVRMSEAKDRVHRLSAAMDKDLRLGTGRAHVNAALDEEKPTESQAIAK